MSFIKKKLGLYIHVPFCLKKCAYCNFYSLSTLSFIPRFVSCLSNHIKTIEFQNEKFEFSSFKVDSIYFGGGTPSLLTSAQLGSILTAIYKTFDVEEDAEISIECNPCSLNMPFLKDLKKLNFNRLSIGVQSALNSELKFLGRLHSFEQAQRAIDFAVAAGFSNISADLIFGLPGQQLKDLDYILNAFYALPLTHLSSYILKIEPGTAFSMVNFDSLLSDDDLADFYEFVVQYFTQKGFCHYEISNFALQGFECRHNLKYWTMEDYYLGFGPGAHSFFNGSRFFIKPDLELYLNDSFSLQFEQDLFEKRVEWLMVRSRLGRPILFSELVKYGYSLQDFHFKLKQLASSNLVDCSSCGFSLTTKGFLVQNAIVLFLTC